MTKSEGTWTRHMGGLVLIKLSEILDMRLNVAMSGCDIRFNRLSLGRLGYVMTLSVAVMV